MAGQKNRITFFKRDVDMTNDTRMRKVLRRYGGLGVAVYEEVLAMVYETGSYYLPWSDDYALDIADRLYEPDQEKIRQIIGLLIETGLFSKELFDEFGILTSRGIQERFTDRGEQSHRRKEIQRYALIEEEGARECAELRDHARDCAGVRANAQNCADMRATARDCAEMRDNAQTCAKMRSRERERARDRAIVPPPTPPLVGNEGGEDVLPCSESLSDSGETTERDDDEAIQPEKSDLSPLTLALRGGSPPYPKSTPKHTNGGYRGNYGDSVKCDLTALVVDEWNKRFRGTRSEYRYPRAEGNLRDQIQQRLELDPDIGTFGKVFDYARLEYEGNGVGNHQFVWTLTKLFNKEETFDWLLAKADAPQTSAASHRQRGAPVLTEADYLAHPFG